MTRHLWLIVAAVSLMACQTAAPRGHKALDLSRVSLTVPGVSGLSGLTTDGNGHLWAVSERDWVLLEFSDGQVIRTVNLPPMGEEVDLEAVTWLAGNRFALGTERDLARDSDDIVEVKVIGDTATITRRWPLHYGPLGLDPEPNEGVEALCALGPEWLLAIGEPVVTDPDTGERRAPMWRATTSGQGVTHGWLSLTSEEGKIAALACRPLGDEAY
ncbi:MAG: SdiA-regulated domain-containing protein, partial [Myxococcota bacterium]|nr:SdiA-regulated domain-containing protein [Myxococcota bacterium]